jgi:hypothetical protein
VILPSGARKENLTFIVDGVPTKAFDYNETTGVATLTIVNPAAGNHTVRVDYAEDLIYANNTNSTTFNVAKVEPGIKEFNVTESIDVGEVANVTVKLPEDANGTITVNVNGIKYTADVINGSATLSIPNLGNGTHKLNITYSGDNNYDPVHVDKDVTVNKITPDISANTTEITLGDNAVIDVNITQSDVTGTVTVKVAGIEKTVAVTGGVNSIIIPGVSVGTHDVEVIYNGNDKYTNKTASTQLKVNKKPTSPDDIKVIDNGDGTVTVIVPDNATGNVTVKIGDEELPVEQIKDGKATVNLTNSTKKPGTYDITVTYSGDENHTGTTTNATGTVPKWDSALDPSAPKIRQGDDATITVKLTPKDDVSGKESAPIDGMVYAEIDGKTYAGVVDSNGVATITVPGLKEGGHDINLTYAGNQYYNAGDAQTKITVEAPITVNVTGKGEDSKAVIDLPKNATKNVTVYIDGNKTNVTFDENGDAIVNLTDFMPGEHNITVVYVDQNGNPSLVNTTIVVPKWPSSVNASAPVIREGDDLPVTVEVNSPEMTGLVLVDLDGTGYYANLTNGKVYITAPGIKKGTYIANVTYLGDDKYENATNTFKVVVEGPITITVEGAGNSTKVIVGLPDNSTDNVVIYVDGKKVSAKVSDGKAVADLNNIAAGKHKVTVVYTDKDGHQSTVTQTITVYNSIRANDMTRGWNSPFDFEAEFLDKDGHVIANTVMQFKVNGKTYKVKTDNKGIAKLTTSHLAVGKYKVQITNTKTKEVMTKSVTIVKRLIGNKNIKMDFVDGTYYTVKAIGDNGKPVTKGEVVGIKVNGRGYVATTNSKGIAKLKINLNPKTYKITAEYAKYKVSNKLVVKQTLKLVKKAITVKKTAKSFKIKAKLKWTKTGKAIKGKKVTIKFFGKKYKVKTNSKGIAKVTIKKSVIKKLKIGKKYSYSVTYISNIVKGSVKAKK